MDNQIIYISAFPKKQVVGLVFETIEEAQRFTKKNFPEAKITISSPHIFEAETDMFKIVYVPAHECFLGQRLNHLFTTNEIEQSKWFKTVADPMLTER